MKKNSKAIGRDSKKDLNSFKSKGVLNIKNDNNRNSAAILPKNSQTDLVNDNNSPLPTIQANTVVKRSMANFKTSGLLNKASIKNSIDVNRQDSNRVVNKSMNLNFEDVNNPYGNEPNLDIPDTKQPENTDNVKVVARFRPLNKVEQDLFERGMGGICVKYHKKDGCTITNSVGFTQNFTLDRIFDSNTNQKTLFEEAAAETIRDILKGYNGTIFTYGQSGSGKTHTMYGASLYDEDLKGIIPRTIEYLFDFINHPCNEQIKFQIKFSMLEIYKENLYDLLNPEVDSKDLKIKETKDKQIYVTGLTEEYISNIEEFLLLIDQADQYRVVSETGLNKQSSRSHLLFIIEVLQQLPDGSEKCGKLNLIDLAGSEKISKTGAVGETLEEAKKINLSLSTLGQVISSLSSDKDYVPYRDSKLTRVLQDSLGGNFKTTLIVACSPHVFNSEESSATLKFATRAKKIKNKVKQNIKKSTEELERIIEELTQKLQKAKDHILKLKKKINALPESLKQEYKEVFDDLQLDADKDIKEIINLKSTQQKIEIGKLNINAENARLSQSSEKQDKDDLVNKEENEADISYEKISPREKSKRTSMTKQMKTLSFVSNTSRTSNSIKKQTIGVDKEDKSPREISFQDNNIQTIDIENKSRDESVKSNSLSRSKSKDISHLKVSNEFLAIESKNEIEIENDKVNTFNLLRHRKNQTSIISETSKHVDLQDIDSFRFKIDNNNDKSQSQSNINTSSPLVLDIKKMNYYDSNVIKELKEKYERIISEKDKQLKSLATEIEVININSSRQKEAIALLKDKIKMFEQKEEISISKLEIEVDKITK